MINGEIKLDFQNTDKVIKTLPKGKKKGQRGKKVTHFV
jgi:hypothetical protein